MSLVELSPQRLAAGEQCTTDAIGVSDALWRYDESAGWSRVPHAATAEGQVWPRRRYAATAWSLADRGLLFSGEFEFCRHRDYDMTGSYYPPINVPKNTSEWCDDCGHVYRKCPEETAACDVECFKVVNHVIQTSDELGFESGLANQAADDFFQCVVAYEDWSSTVNDVIASANDHPYYATRLQIRYISPVQSMTLSQMHRPGNFWVG